MWSLKFNKTDEAYLKHKGAAILNEKVFPQNAWAWSAFQALRGSRQYGMSVGPVPISEIASYCDFVGLNDTVSKQRLARFVMALDQAEREHGNTRN